MIYFSQIGQKVGPYVYQGNHRGEDMEEKDKYSFIVSSTSFQQLIREKRRFLVPIILFFTIFYFCLPLSVGLFPERMGRSIPGISLSWAWLYAFSQLGMTWFVGWLYWRKAKSFDRLVEEVQKQQRDRR